MIEESSNVVYEERIQHLGDLFLVGKFKGALEWNPDPLQMHWANLDNVLLLLALENTVTAASGHASNIEKLSAINHMIIFSSGYASSLDINLEA